MSDEKTTNSRRRWRPPKHAELSHFTLLDGVLVAVAVVVYLSSLKAGNPP